MGILKRADRTESTTYWDDDHESYIKLRTHITKKEANRIMQLAPSGDRDLEGGFRFLESFFVETIEEWSLEDDDGAPVEPSVEEYYKLDAAAGRWVDECVGKHLQVVMGTKIAALEGESKS